MKPFFSVMIPVYNVKDYLDNCMSTILNQTFDDYEVILVDDGSTDGSGDICDRYQFQNPEKVRVVHKENGGLLSARRVGVAVAEGKYGAFVDSDDYVSNDFLQVIYETIIKNEQPDVVIYNFARHFEVDDSIVINEPVFKNGTLFRGNKEQVYDKLISGYSLNNLWAKSVKMDLIKNDDTEFERYYKNSFGEDLLQSLYPITYADKIVYIDSVLYYYRINAQSMTAAKNFSVVKKQNDPYIFYVMQEYISKWELDKCVYLKKLFARRYNHLAINFFRYYKAETCADNKKELIQIFKSYFKEMRNENLWSNGSIPLKRKLIIFLVNIGSFRLLQLLMFFN